MKRIILTMFLMACFVLVHAQTRLLTGSVADGENDPLPGVSVIVKGTTTGTVTDVEGQFKLNVDAPENKTLVFSSIGYLTQEHPIGNQTTFDIVLKEDLKLLDEVVVVGYGIQRKKLVTGATSQVKGEDMQRLNTVSAIDALKSNTTGVQIVKTSGQPGSGFKVNIRGLGTTGDATPLYIVDGVQVGDIDFLNPADIESTDILKDAASASIYGSRAANGVILITTKKGSFNAKPSIGYDMYYGVQNLYKTLPTLNAQENAMIMDEARINDGLDPFDYASLVPNWNDIASGKSKGTNWLEETRVKNAPIQNHSVTINGGSETSTYAVGLSYTDQQGIFGKPVAPFYQRYTGRVNLEQILLKLNGRDFLKSGQSAIYTYSQNAGIAVGGVYWNSLKNLIVTSPFLPMYDENGEYHKSIPWRSTEPNPIAIMHYNQGQNKSKNHNLVTNVYLELSPIENLKFKTNFGYTNNSGSYRNFSPAYNLSIIDIKPENSVFQSMWNGIGFTFENTLTYAMNAKENHHLDFLVGNTIQKSGLGENLEGSNVNSIFDDFKHAYLINTPAIIPGKTSLKGEPWGENKLLSYFGRINYNYAEKYLLTLIMRADGSSKFARGKRWGYFPSVAAGWVVSSEPFMEGTSDWLDMFKLRASWGQNGNQNISSFQYLSTISFIGADYFGISKDSKLTGAYPDVLPNPNITWETSEQTNFGIDARFLDSRLDVVFDLYKKSTKDWLVRAPVLASYGTNAPFINGGNVDNNGVELGVNWRSSVDKVNYFIGGNVSYNKNNVTKISNTEKIIHGPSTTLGTGMSELFRAEEGFPIGYFWGYETDGIFQNETEVLAYKNSKGELVQPDATPGDLRFVNKNDDNLISDADKVMIGDPNPDFTFGLNLGADYKGFYFTVTGNGVAGNQIARNYRTPDVQRNNYTTEIFGRWHGEGTSNKIPKVSMSTHINRQYVSDLYIEDGDYFRISNITFGYDIKNIKTLIPIQGIRIYASLQNAYTFTKYKGMDPEVGFNGDESFGSGIDVGFYPAPRTVLFGLNVKF